LQVDATFQANSGHPGAPMGMAPVAHVVFNKFMTFNPKNPNWVNRDRFVLSYVYFTFSSGLASKSATMAEADCGARVKARSKARQLFPRPLEAVELAFLGFPETPKLQLLQLQS
jgi:hypothetical protein